MSGKHPWISGNLVIRASVLADIEAHALQTYPKESCGFLSGPLDPPLLVDTCIREVNEADKYHALDPERFPRTSETYFKINELRALRHFDTGLNGNQPIKAIYHSHCDAGAYFSEEDAATFASQGQLMWPCAFVVLSVQQGKLADRKLWIHVPHTNTFTESTLHIE